MPVIASPPQADEAISRDCGKKTMNRQAGFTLIEVVVTLVLVGIMAAVAGMAIVQGVQGYVFARENATTTQKAQLAMVRMSRELIELTDVTSAGDSPTTIVYDRDSDSHTIAFDNVNACVTLDAGVLVDDVSSLSLSYWKSDGTTAWVQGTHPIEDLSTIQIDLALSRPDIDIGTIIFTTTIHPRYI